MLSLWDQIGSFLRVSSNLAALAFRVGADEAVLAVVPSVSRKKTVLCGGRACSRCCWWWWLLDAPFVVAAAISSLDSEGVDDVLLGVDVDIDVCFDDCVGTGADSSC